MYERWVTNSQPQWRQLWSGMLRPGSPKGIEKSVETVLESGLSCCVLNRSWTVHKGWVTDCWPVMASASPSKSLPQLWSAKKKKKREGDRRAWKLFWKLDCRAVINRSRTMQKRWVTDSWPVMASASPLKSLPQLWSSMRRLGPPKNKEKSVKTVLETGLSCCDEQILNCARDGWLIADPW